MVIDDADLAKLVHDLRSPTTAIRWSVESLLETVGTKLTPQETEIVEIIKTSADKLNNQIDLLSKMPV